MTQEQLAEAIGVSKRSVGSWERGEAIPRNRIGAISDLLGLDDGFPEFGVDAIRRRLGELGKQRREELGLSSKNFTDIAGLGSDKTVRQFEFARVMPSGVVQRKLEKALGWRLGAIDAALRDVNRKASSITMEMLDAEDSLFMAKEAGGGSIESFTDEVLVAELWRRLKVREGVSPRVTQDLFDLAASHNSEHLEDEEDHED